MTHSSFLNTIVFLSLYISIQRTICIDYFFVYDQTLSWAAANSYCQTNCGSQLATIYDDEAAQELADLVWTYSSASPYAWIGLNDIDTEGMWVYADGSTCGGGSCGGGYRYWMHKQPDNRNNQDCAFLRTPSLSSLIDDGKCGNWQRFICNPGTCVMPTAAPTQMTQYPTSDPTLEPTNPTTTPSNAPTSQTEYPTTDPTLEPTEPTYNPTTTPSDAPTSYPTLQPSYNPTTTPSESPTQMTQYPTVYPTLEPTYNPTTTPSDAPTSPTEYPTLPSRVPTITSQSPTRPLASNYTIFIGLNCDDDDGSECSVDTEALEQHILVAIAGDVVISRFEMINDEVVISLSITTASGQVLQTDDIKRDIEREIEGNPHLRDVEVEEKDSVSEDSGDDAEKGSDAEEKQSESMIAVGIAAVTCAILVFCGVPCLIFLNKRQKRNIVTNAVELVKYQESTEDAQQNTITTLAHDEAKEAEDENENTAAAQDKNCDNVNEGATDSEIENDSMYEKVQPQDSELLYGNNSGGDATGERIQPRDSELLYVNNTGGDTTRGDTTGGTDHGSENEAYAPAQAGEKDVNVMDEVQCEGDDSEEVSDDADDDLYDPDENLYDDAHVTRTGGNDVLTTRTPAAGDDVLVTPTAGGGVLVTPVAGVGNLISQFESIKHVKATQDIQPSKGD